MVRAVISLTPWFSFTALVVLGAVMTAGAQVASVSESLSGPIGDTASLYTESATVGTSSTIAPGSNNLTTSYNRSGTNDPFHFQIESGAMSPYVSAGLDSYAYFAIMSGTLNDPLVSQQFAEYRNNSRQMSGVVLQSQSHIFGSVSANSGTAFSQARDVNRAGTFGAEKNISAAGSSMATSANVAKSSYTGTLDALAMGSDASPSGGGINAGSVGMTSGDGSGIAASDTASSGTISSTAELNAAFDGSADRMPAGPSPGAIFPNLSYMSSSPSRFPDSTMGTAGQQIQVEGPAGSPLLSPLGAEGGSPFLDVSSGLATFLHPGMRTSKAGRAKLADLESSDEAYEKGRRATIQRMIQNPGAPPPSAFERQRAFRGYLDRSSSGGSTEHRAPSIVATPTIR